MYPAASAMDHSDSNAAQVDPMYDPHAAEWERTYAMFEHLSGASFLLGLPVIPALVLWLIKREQSPFVDDHGKEALNFQISLLIYGLASSLLATACIGWPLLVATIVLGIIGIVQGAMAAHAGRYCRCPATIRLVK
jgi:uncharacterized Tic20 family protein